MAFMASVLENAKGQIRQALMHIKIMIHGLIPRAAASGATTEKNIVRYRIKENVDRIKKYREVYGA